uniref:Fibrillar collagen NC1 domain-containing protein n=1 Tax=Mola mola TaxID=94237 RepID=A0A3Q3WR40_MOLML
MTFLQLLSATAKQTFTYHCLNSAAWLHSATHSHERALRFRGADGEELTHENAHYITNFMLLHLENIEHLFIINWFTLKNVQLIPTMTNTERKINKYIISHKLDISPHPSKE